MTIAASPVLASVVSACALVACTRAPGDMRRMESDAELQARDNREFASSPNMQLPELRKRLHALGVDEQEIREELEEHGVATLKLTMNQSKFDQIDKSALADLEYQSRYRLRLSDEQQSIALAHVAGPQENARRKARALRELAKNGEMDHFPRYRQGMPMTGYARALEHYCGYRSGEALNVIDGSWLEYRNRMVDKAVEDIAGRKHGRASFDCVVRIVYATDLQPYFIGNRGLQKATRT